MTDIYTDQRPTSTRRRRSETDPEEEHDVSQAPFRLLGMGAFEVVCILLLLALLAVYSINTLHLQRSVSETAAPEPSSGPGIATTVSEP